MSTLALDVRLERAGFSLAVQQDIALEGITVIFGPSASGKTTLLRIIAGLERAARGSVLLDGTAWQTADNALPAHRRGIGYVFQDGRLFTHLSVRGNLTFAAQRSTRTAVTFEAAVSALDLAPLLERRPASLSGGEQQRVAIARALLTNPRLLLMDEPLSSLDIGRKREILPLIEQLPRTFGVPVLYVTHNVDEAARLASHVLLLRAGRVTGFGTLAEVFHGPALDRLTDELEPGAVLRTRVTAHTAGTATLAVGTQTLRVPMADATIGAIRPVRIHARDVAIATERPRNLSIRNVLSARILEIDPAPSGNVDVLLDVEDGQLRSRITRDACEELRLAAGQNVFVLIKSVALESTLLG